MKHLILLLSTAVFFNLSAKAQNKITGSIYNDSSKILPYATVELQNDSLSGHAPKGTLADEHGRFELFALSKGSYHLFVSIIGYKTFQKQLFVNADTTLIIKLNDSISTLSDVIISLKKPIIEKKVDRFVFNVKNTPFTVGGNAWDILKHAPLVAVKNSGSVSIIGSSGSTVYINGRKSLLSGEDLESYLQSMPAGNILKIEVITSPPANFEAGNGGGVINIILKKIPDNGLKGSITINDQQATYNKQRASMQLNYKHNHYSQSLTLGGGFGKSFSSFYNTINYYNIDQQEVIDEKYLSDGKSLTASTSVEYELSKKSQIGAMVGYSNNNGKTNDNSLDYIFMNTDPETFQNSNSGTYSSQFLSGNLYYKYYFQQRNAQSLLINLDFFNYNSKNDGTFYSRNSKSLNEIYNGNQSNTRQNINNYSFKVDYSQQILNNIMLQTGVKYSYTQTKNPYNFFNYSDGDWVYNPQISNNFIYKEAIGAIYASLEKKLSSKISIKAGARLENTNINTRQEATSEKNSQNYTKLLPTAYFSYKINAENNLSFSIRNDFSRAPFYTLNPFKDFTGNKVIEVGNPFLIPSPNTLYELSYVLKSNYIFLAQYQHSTSLFGQVQTIILPDTLLYQQANYGKSNSLSLTSVINQIIIKNKWEANISNSVQSLTYNINAGKIQSNKTNFIYTVSLNQTFKNIFNSKVDASLYAMYQSKLANANVIGKSFGEVDFGLSKKFVKAGFKLGIYVNDIFKTAIFNNYSIGDPAFLSQLRSYYDSRYVRISIVKSFGNKKIKALQKRESGNAEEKNRVQ